MIWNSRSEEYNYCWACRDVSDRGFDLIDTPCIKCLINWPGDSCGSEESPYNKWRNEVFSDEPDKELCKKYSLEVVELIKTTWKE